MSHLSSHCPPTPSQFLSKIQYPQLLSQSQVATSWRLVLGSAHFTLLRPYFILTFSNQCETASVKGPIAIFDPSDESSGPRLIIYETLHDKYDARPNLIHHGVSLLLLDYLLVTAMFLVTNVQDWIRPEKFTHAHVNITSDSTPPSSSSASRKSMTDVQWRKIMFREPLFPKRSQSSVSLTSSLSDGIQPVRLTRDQMEKLAYGHPLYPKLRPSTPDFGLSDSEDDDQQIFFSPIRSRPPSPAAESIFDPRSAAGAPSHNYIDPSFYTPPDPSPAMPSPVRYTQSSGSTSRALTSSPSEFRSAHHLSSRQSSSSRPNSVYPATIPDAVPELPLVLPLIPRPRSTPPRSILSAPPTPISPAPPQTLSDISATISSPIESSLAMQPRRPSRQLPQLPIRNNSPSSSLTSPLDSPMERSRSRSSSLHHEQKWSNGHYRQRTLPSPPTSSGSTYVHSPGPGDADRGVYPHLRSVLKECDVPWTADRPDHESDGVRLQIPYDVPPPAYSSIFSTSSVPPSNGGNS